MCTATRIVLIVLLALPACSTARGQGSDADGVTSPSEHLGRPLGVDFELADWDEVSSYHRRLAEESPRVICERIGTSTEGRDYLLTIVSSEANLARLDELRGHAGVLADPRGRSDAEKAAAIADGRVILLISPAMHSTETSGSQWGMEFAYLLATSEDEPWVAAREEIVVAMFACTNPDGVDHVTGWYRETVGTPYEGTGLLKLYQLYTGHDNNRDWFMLSQAETRIVTEQLYSVWHPQVYWDVHQQGSGRERLFVPPFRDPLNPNLDPAIITGIDLIGTRALHDLTREGFTGVSTGVSYDMWWNGGNRNVPVRHNIIGLLTEAASVNLASPIFLPHDELSGPRGIEGGYIPSNRFPNPWPGGWWRLRDIIDYQHAFGRSLLGTLAREPELWRRNALEASERTIARGTEEAPRGWVIPADNRDPSAVRRLVDALILGGVEVHVADGGIEVDGRAWPAGSIVIRRDQPYGQFVKDLMEVQRYPDGSPPYDVAGWTLPLLLGVHRVELIDMPDVGLRLAETADDAIAAFPGDTRADPARGVLSARDSSSWTHLAAELADGRPMHVRDGLFVPGPPEEEGTLTLDTLPRIGLYAPWQGSMDEGWTRYVLDAWEIPHVRVRNEMLRAGNLRDVFDVIVIASIGAGQIDAGRAPGTIPHDYARGLDPEGAVAVDTFVREGGRLITFGAACAWAIDLFELPLVNVTDGEEAGEFSCPGSVLRGLPSPDGGPLTDDLPRSVALFFSRSAAWREMTGDERAETRREERPLETLLVYAPSRVLLSGWIRAPEVIEGRAAWVRAEIGDGAVHLFGFRPQYRSWSQQTFGLIFRAMFLDRD